jgi:hypothetical protein
LVFALSRREAYDRQHQVGFTEQEDRAQAEQRRASLGYLFWPAALYEQFVEREPASSWYRQQIRQALTFGVRSACWGTAALLWPLVLSLIFGNLTATLVFYATAIVLDIVLLARWLKRALTYSKRAARGETFVLYSPAPLPQTRGIPAKH